jgi:UDP-N-acetyl-D-mannosaminuronic acid transferase (WecB/TagA/CpsF family)
MGLGMLSKKRMGITPPKRIEGMDQLKAILERAKELEVD